VYISQTAQLRYYLKDKKTGKTTKMYYENYKIEVTNAKVTPSHKPGTHKGPITLKLKESNPREYTLRYRIHGSKNINTNWRDYNPSKGIKLTQKAQVRYYFKNKKTKRNTKLYYLNYKIK